jgi:Mn2+/Fe2+ NRAMP family transporter
MPGKLEVLFKRRQGCYKSLRMTVWKHVFHIFFVGFVVIILTTSARLRAVDPLFGCLTVKLIITFEGSVFCHKPTPLLKVIVRFQCPQDQMILATLDMDGAIDCVGPLEGLARLICEEAMDP